MSHSRCVRSRRQLARVCSLYHVNSRNQMQAWRKSLYLTGQASRLPPSSRSEHQGMEKKQPRKNTGQVWILASPRDASVLTFVKWGSSDFHLTWQLQLWPKHEFCPHCSEIAPKDFIYLPFVFFFLHLCGIPPCPLLRGKWVRVFHFQPKWCWTSYFHDPRSDAEPLWRQSERKCVESLGPQCVR